ncbi:hypothetical protein SAV31267_102860 [Streptomyces avermitilis]|uniref:Uncharacterized protein n=1 Tax=Streptomyces avermitilis TaxID=33903 RepID=A0A4D4N893_STRAX|nr:hypothetical protein SAV31267_102860 [Streptomyces avermitilis]
MEEAAGSGGCVAVANQRTVWGRPLWLSSLRVRHRARVRVVDSSSGSESRVVPAVTLTSEEARPVPVGGSATRPRGRSAPVPPHPGIQAFRYLRSRSVARVRSFPIRYSSGEWVNRIPSLTIHQKVRPVRVGWGVSRVSANGTCCINLRHALY